MVSVRVSGSKWCTQLHHISPPPSSGICWMAVRHGITFCHVRWRHSEVFGDIVIHCDVQHWRCCTPSQSIDWILCVRWYGVQCHYLVSILMLLLMYRFIVVIHDAEFSCEITQPLLAHHWRVHQCLLTSRFIAPLIPWVVSDPGGRWGSSFLRTITLSIIYRFLSLKVLLLIYMLFKKHWYKTFQFEKLFWIWWKVLDTIISWQDAGPCCVQTHAAFEVGLNLDQGPGVYSRWSDVDGSSQVRLCHTCIIDVMAGIIDMFISMAIPFELQI